MNIELYIDNQLADLGSTDLAIRLKRQFITPNELNTKDAQKSYTITLPPTDTNKQIFGYRHIEEVQGKFVVFDNSRLYVEGVCIFNGKFRLSEISASGFTGNLGVPAAKTAKDIFGETKMAKAGGWKQPFSGINSISSFNAQDNPPCIFPLVLYGLLPKNKNYSEGKYTDKEVFDNSVVLGLDDFPPSVNCIQMLKQQFANAGYTLSGTAVDDERLNRLYVSYKNASDYEMPWSYGPMTIEGTWQRYKDGKLDTTSRMYKDEFRCVTNIFEADNHVVTKIEDEGYNIRNYGGQTQIYIPASGLYKISFTVDYSFMGHQLLPVPINGSYTKEVNMMEDRASEIKLIRNFDGDLESIIFDNQYYRDNTKSQKNDEIIHFPQRNKVNFIDPAQNKNLLCGFRFGKNKGGYRFENPADEEYDKNNTSFCNPMAISGGESWTLDLPNDTEEEIDTNIPIESYRAIAATQSPGYYIKPKDGGYTLDETKFRVALNKDSYTTYNKANAEAHGEVYQVIWLEKGETISLLDTNSNKHDSNSFQSFNYSLTLEPFNIDPSWVQMNPNGSSENWMNWNDAVAGFDAKEINLMRFLPAEVKINDWVDNFCKAFNLELRHTGGNSMQLNLRHEDLPSRTGHILDLDAKADIRRCTSQTLGLPAAYKLGFTVDQDEEGYYRSMTNSSNEEYFDTGNRKVLGSGNDGGGSYTTGSSEANVLEQNSDFSYCWYKNLYGSEEDKKSAKVALRLPVISDHEVWEDTTRDYNEMMAKQYSDKAQRFWYKEGTRNVPLFRYQYTQKDEEGNDQTIEKTQNTVVAMVTGGLEGRRKQILDYRNQPDSILRNYFLLLDNASHYTIVECYLTPDEYDVLHLSQAKLNGDLYMIAEVDGYDPAGNSMCKLKLIRKVM